MGCQDKEIGCQRSRGDVREWDAKMGGGMLGSGVSGLGTGVQGSRGISRDRCQGPG